MPSEVNRSGDIHLFLDTNVFLHYNVFGDQNWNSVAGGTVAGLYVTPTVLDELDSHKWKGPTKRVKARAETVVAKLKQIGTGKAQFPGTVPLLLTDDRLDEMAVRKRGLSSASADDRILAEILCWAEQEPNKHPVLVTADGGPYLRAPRFGIESVEAPADWRLKDEPDPLEVENRELMARLHEIEGRAPRLELRFAASGSANGVLEAQMTAPRCLTPEELEAAVARIVAEECGPPSNVRATNPIVAAPLWASLQQIPGMESVPDYTAHVRAYLVRLQEHDDAVARTLSIPVTLGNNGSAPAKDITARFTLAGESHFLLEEDIPKQPERPRRRTNLLGLGTAYPDYGPLPVIRSQYLPNVSGLVVDGQLARGHVGTLRHRSSVELGTLHVQFPIHEAVGSFSISYEVLVSEPPDTIEGTVHVKITKSGVSGGGEEAP